MASWKTAFAAWTANILFIMSENADRVDYLYGEGGSVEKEGTGVKWANIIYIYIYKSEIR